MAGALPPFAWSATLRTLEDLLPFGKKTAEYLRLLGRLRILDGRFVDVTFDAASTANVLHGLERQFYGCIVVRSTDATGTPSLTALDPASVLALGLDPAKYVCLGASSAFTATVTLWVF
jgi:hypothetical protein